MDSTETASSTLAVPSAGDDENIGNTSASIENGASDDKGLEKVEGVDIKEENSSDPFVDSVKNDQSELVGREAVEGGDNGYFDKVEVEKSTVDVGNEDKVGALECGEGVEESNSGSVTGIEVGKGSREENSGDPIAGSTDNFVVEDKTAGDDVEKVSKGWMLEGENNVEEGGEDSNFGTEPDSVDLNMSGTEDGESKLGVTVGTESSGIGEVEEIGGDVVKTAKEDEGEKDTNLDDGAVGSVSEGKNEEGMLAKAEEPTEASNGEMVATTEEEVTEKIENSKSSDVEKVNAEDVGPKENAEAEGLKVTSQGDSVVDAIEVNVSEPGAVVNGDLKESAEGLKVTSQGDSVVDAIEVNASEPGVVVIGDLKESEDVQTKEVELPVNESVSLAKRNDTTSQLSEEVAAAMDTNGESLGPAVDENIDTSEPKLMDSKADMALAENQNIDEKPAATDIMVNEKPNDEIEEAAASHTNENGTMERMSIAGEVKGIDGVAKDDDRDVKLASEVSNLETEQADVSSKDGEVENKISDRSLHLESARVGVDQHEVLEVKDQGKNLMAEEDDLDGSISDDTEGVIFGNSAAAKQFIEELERGSGGGSHSGVESSHGDPRRIDGQIVTDSDEEGETDEEGGEKELFDPSALAALLKAATGADSEGGSITFTSQDGTRLFSVERPAGLGSSLQSMRPAPRPNRPSLFSPTTVSSNAEAGNNLSDEEKNKLEKLQDIRVKYLRLIHRLGVSPEESIVNQVLYRLQLIAGRQSNQIFNMDSARRMAVQLEAERKDDLDFSVNILVLGKCGVGKSATINSIYGEKKASIAAFEPGTSVVKEISGFVDGVKIRVFDTPGLKTSVMEQGFNRRVLSSVKKVTKRTPPDILLYLDRLDAPTRDLNDLSMLRTITSSLGTSIWRSAIVTLTHAASAPPDGPSGSPLSYDGFVTQRSRVVQQSIGQAMGDLRMMSPSLMNPVSLVENHPSCRKNREGQKVLPNGQSWRPQLLLLCYSMKILAEASALSKPQESFDHRKLFGFRARSPPLPYMLSSMLQSRPHPKLSAEQGGDNGDSDIDLDDFSDNDPEEEDEYDQLPPFKPLRKAQLAKLSSEQRNAYFEEYYYRVKLLQKKQWREELRRMREMKKRGNNAAIDYGYQDEDADSGAAAPVAVPLPDMALPPSFDSDYPAYRYRFLEPTSQFLARPVLDTHGWDHDCGYDGVNLEHSLAIASRFPASYTIQITKDKKDFTINLDSSIAAKHGEIGSTMAGFDIQSIGKQLAYIIRGDTKFKNLKKNKTAGGISITFLGENVVPGVKVEDQITIGKQYVLTGSAGAVRSQQDTAYGANFELQRREQDYPIGQVQSTLSVSAIKWRGDLALGFNGLSQFSLGRSSKVTVRAGINNKLSGQISVRTSSSEHLSLALAAVIPTAIAIYRKLWPEAGEKYSIY